MEKILKAVLIKRTGRFPKIHDLFRLGKLVDVGEDLLKDCEKLAPVYIGARYPDVGDMQSTRGETIEDIKSAEKIIEWAIKKLS